MKPVVIGIDVGTTVLKAAAFDAATGAVLASVGQRLPVRTAADGTSEQDSDAVNRAIAAGLGRLRRALGRTWSAVTGIGLAAQGGSFCIVDRRTGAARTPLRLWNDQRCARFLPEVAALRPPAYWRRLARSDGPGMGLARLLWLRASRPRLFDERNLYVGVGELAYFSLTDRWQQDAGNALQIGCYNVGRGRLDAEPLSLVGVPPSFVAPMRDGHGRSPLSTEAARRFGLARGVAVAGPYFDHEAGFLAACGVSRRPLQCSLGTAWVGNVLLPETARWKSSNALVVPAVHRRGWLVVQPLLTGNPTWDWARETFTGARGAEGFRRAETWFDERLLPPLALTALPWLHIANPLHDTALGSGGFFGVNTHTRRSDFLRAAAAGMTFELARVFAQVAGRGKVDSVVLSGGASRAGHFRVLCAALFHPLPVFAAGDEGLCGPRGAVYAFSRAAAASDVVAVRPPPAAVRDAVAEAFALYGRVFDRVMGRRHGAEPIVFQPGA